MTAMCVGLLRATNPASVSLVSMKCAGSGRMRGTQLCFSREGLLWRIPAFNLQRPNLAGKAASESATSSVAPSGFAHAGTRTEAQGSVSAPEAAANSSGHENVYVLSAYSEITSFDVSFERVMAHRGKLPLVRLTVEQKAAPVVRAGGRGPGMRFRLGRLIMGWLTLGQASMLESMLTQVLLYSNVTIIVNWLQLHCIMIIMRMVTIEYCLFWRTLGQRAGLCSVSASMLGLTRYLSPSLPLSMLGLPRCQRRCRRSSRPAGVRYACCFQLGCR